VEITDSERDAKAEAARLEREAEHIYQAQQTMLGNRRTNDNPAHGGAMECFTSVTQISLPIGG